jgi:hypothetical protein
MDDIEYQLGFVVDATWRILSIQDTDELSPSYGCFHYGYWRDKTSEFADVRFQEVGATLGLLSMPTFDKFRDEGRLCARDKLYDRFSASVAAWSAFQYPDGCWDEWYKGERGFAVTEFTTIAYGLAVKYMGDRIDPGTHKTLIKTMRKAGDWLATRHDRVKANHEAAAAAALALVWHATGDEIYRAAAKDKIQDVLARQKSEGWFPEIGGMDLGYCSVLLDYVMIYIWITDDQEVLPAVKKLVEFMAPLVHPDGTISPEVGLCLNPYVSRIGFLLASRFGDKAAAKLLTDIREHSPGRQGLTPYLSDDLRFCRWSYLPVIVALESKAEDNTKGSYSYPTDQWIINSDSATAVFRGSGFDVFFAIAGGGVIRLYKDRKLKLEDIGIDIADGADSWGCSGYNAARHISRNDDKLGFTTGMGRASYFYPGFLSRLILRLGSTTRWGSKFLRHMIDQQRLKKGTAVNQSSAPMAEGREDFTFQREVVINGDVITIEDVVTSPKKLMTLDSLRMKCWFQNERVALDSAANPSHSFRITKVVNMKSDVPTITLSV